jgi:hypothetical protein
LFPQKTFLKILVGLDGWESSFEAADSAMSLAKHYGSELIAIHERNGIFIRNVWRCHTSFFKKGENRAYNELPDSRTKV